MTNTTGRIMSPEMAFAAVLRQAQKADSQGKSTITKGEAEKAITQLEGHPHADAAERARIVQSFLDGNEGKALSAKARDVLSDFVKTQNAAGGGQKATELKADAAREAGGAVFQLDMARGHVAQLLAKGGLTAKGELAKVTAALNAALENVKDARKSLTSMLKVADHGAQLADTQLGAAGKEIEKAKADIAKLVGGKGGAVTKAQLNEIQTWLADPKTELRQAQTDLGNPARVTRKFPSDAEDGGFNPFGPPPGGGGGGGAVTLKYPSDNEDGNNTGPGGGPIFHTMKAPSDHEDGGPNIHPPAPGTVKKIDQQRIDDMGKVFNAARNVQWHHSMPLGQRFESQLLKKNPGFDTYQYDVMVPTGALTPTAPQKDPNKVNEFWVRRSGGLAGLTEYAGPFTLKAGSGS